MDTGATSFYFPREGVLIHVSAKEETVCRDRRILNEAADFNKLTIFARGKRAAGRW